MSTRQLRPHTVTHLKNFDALSALDQKVLQICAMIDKHMSNTPLNNQEMAKFRSALLPLAGAVKASWITCVSIFEEAQWNTNKGHTSALKSLGLCVT
jgi:hypothetical protein